MTLRLDLPEMPALDLVTVLGDPHRAFRAYTRLLALGPEATEAARGGLAHPDERVREQCCKILDHLMDADSIPLLIGALADPCERVRIAAVHALACDRCKTGSLPPHPRGGAPGRGRPAGRRPVRRVRAYAAELVGQWAHSQPAARDAITRAAAQTRRRRSGRRHPGTPRAELSTSAPRRASCRGRVAAAGKTRHERGRWFVWFAIGC